MCLALPALLVEKLPEEQAVVQLGGVRKTISLAFVPEANVGDHVIVHVGHAIGVLDPEEAARTLAEFACWQASLAPEPEAGANTTESGGAA